MLKKTKFLIIATGVVALPFSAFAQTALTPKEDLLSPIGYWVQYDEDKGDGYDHPEGVIQGYESANGNLEFKIVVPLMQVGDSGEIDMPMIHCEKCGKGSVAGQSYDYTDPKNNFLEGLTFAWNMKEMPNTANHPTKGAVYDNGGVLNPNDGKTYNSKAQVIDSGKTLFVRAYNSWGLGKNAHWQRIDKQLYENIKAKCGLTKDMVYPYQDKDGKLVNEKLFKECSAKDLINHLL